jgi:hypothetical protein
MHSRNSKEKKDLKALDEMIEDIVIDAGDYEIHQMQRTLLAGIGLPGDAFDISARVYCVLCILRAMHADHQCGQEQVLRRGARQQYSYP